MTEQDSNKIRYSIIECLNMATAINDYEHREDYETLITSVEQNAYSENPTCGIYISDVHKVLYGLYIKDANSEKKKYNERMNYDVKYFDRPDDYNTPNDILCIKVRHWNTYREGLLSLIRMALTKFEVLTSPSEEDRGLVFPSNDNQSKPIAPSEMKPTLQRPSGYGLQYQQPIYYPQPIYIQPQPMPNKPRVNLCPYCKDNDLCDRACSSVFKCNIYKPQYGRKGELFDEI